MALNSRNVKKTFLLDFSLYKVYTEKPHDMHDHIQCAKVTRNVRDMHLYICTFVCMCVIFLETKLNATKTTYRCYREKTVSQFCTTKQTKTPDNSI